MKEKINYIKISELEKVPMNETLSTVKLNCAGNEKNYHAVMGELFSYISTYFVAPAVEAATAKAKEETLAYIATYYTPKTQEII